MPSSAPPRRPALVLATAALLATSACTVANSEAGDADAVSGMMGTATSIGGPPMAMVWQRFAGPRPRSTMGAFFLVESAMSLAALTVSGSVGLHDLRYALFLAPAAALGVLWARPAGKRLDVRRARPAATALALAGATILLVQQFV